MTAIHTIFAVWSVRNVSKDILQSLSNNLFEKKKENYIFIFA